LQTPKGFGFELVTKDRTFLIVAQSKEEMESWMHLFLEIVGNVATETTVPLKIADDEEEPALSADELSNFTRMDTVLLFSLPCLVLSRCCNELFPNFLLLKNVTKEGYLLKEGGKIKPLQSYLLTRRWFVLRESTLAYYKDDKDDKPLGLISLKECKTMLATEKSKKPYSFEISTPGRVYMCTAISDEEMWSWINVITAAIEKAGGKETAEFIALKKVAELAEKRRRLELKVYRKAAAKQYALVHPHPMPFYPFTSFLLSGE